jgi:hypothetical protein
LKILGYLSAQMIVTIPYHLGSDIQNLK